MSPRFSINRADFEKWVHNALVFLAPLGVIYFGSVHAVISVPGHVVSINDFVPTNFTVGAITLYLTNLLFDLSRKFASGK